MNIKQCLFFSGKGALDELAFIYIMSSIMFDSELLIPKKIGKFLRYAIVDAHRFGFENNVQEISKNLRQLLTMEKVDLLLLTNLFVMNNFMNLELMENFEVDNEFFDLKQLKECYNGIMEHSYETKNERDDLHKAKKVLYIKPSPCLNVSKYKNCHGYCNWHKETLKTKKTNGMNEILR